MTVNVRGALRAGAHRQAEARCYQVQKVVLRQQTYRSLSLCATSALRSACDFNHACLRRSSFQERCNAARSALHRGSIQAAKRHSRSPKQYPHRFKAGHTCMRIDTFNWTATAPQASSAAVGRTRLTAFRALPGFGASGAPCTAGRRTSGRAHATQGLCAQAHSITPAY